MPDIGLQAVEGQDHLSLFLETGLDPLPVSDAQGHEFFIAVHQMRHTAQRDADASCHQRLMHFGHTAVLPEAPLANQGNHIQAKLTVRQGPAPFFLLSVGVYGS